MPDTTHEPAAPRDTAIAAARETLESGRFREDLARRVAMPTISREEEHWPELERYLREEMMPLYERLGFSCEILRHRKAPGPFLLAERIEDPARPTVLMYGHGDVVTGIPEQWSEGLDPWEMTERDGRWFGRGTADNKGQHSVNLAALEAVLAVRGRLGFNLKYLVEMGEEYGSPALDAICADHKERLAADVLIASDGPRMSLEDPTIFLGSRGGINLHLEVVAREGFHHSGNWGGLLANPGVELSHAIAALIGPTGECLVPELTPGEIPQNVRDALKDCTITPAEGDPPLDPWWGAPGLTQAERVYAWSTLEVMEIEVGNLAKPLYAIPPWARARLQLRHPVGVDTSDVEPAVRRTLDAAGHERVKIVPAPDASFPASRSDLDGPWVRFAAASLERTAGRAPVILPNLGGSLPNAIFTDILGLPTIWVPHSYPGCRQHGADEHLPVSIVREGLGLMAGLFWDLGETDVP
ncbi:M20 family metallopeptidase [Roseicyclus sp. F158]|uniref:M20 family metallopeptidase n=1 Tax=Tropicimonas omnivorans TaxID=3075590 RepID=A0ABU3DED5_9RHOB|nr:M20 family metallopeptidase [Roseicyclus sp. F158]MDT0682076.1 M20 family metallopeptidase [Roseicyclus sp. F158]